MLFWIKDNVRLRGGFDTGFPAARKLISVPFAPPSRPLVRSTASSCRDTGSKLIPTAGAALDRAYLQEFLEAAETGPTPRSGLERTSPNRVQCQPGAGTRNSRP